MLSILSYLRQGEYLLALISILSSCFVVFCCLPVHELAHGLVAYKLGDTTAKDEGRLTFNPLAHLNPIGTIMIFLFMIHLLFLIRMKHLQNISNNHVDIL